jgi:hypothetical protein
LSIEKYSRAYPHAPERKWTISGKAAHISPEKTLRSEHRDIKLILMGKFFKSFAKNKKCRCPESYKYTKSFGMGWIAICPKEVFSSLAQIPNSNTAENRKKPTNKTNLS